MHHISYHIIARFVRYVHHRRLWEPNDSVNTENKDIFLDFSFYDSRKCETPPHT